MMTFHFDIMQKKTSASNVITYGEDAIPPWVREVIDTALAIEDEDARSSGHLGFMTRALVSATMPYKDPKTKVFERKNGDLMLSILSPKGVPFGRYPRLLLSWIITEAVKSQSPIIPLGESLAQFLRESIGVSSTGGSEGTVTRVSEQMLRLFTSLITVERQDINGRPSFSLENVLLAQRAQVTEADRARFDTLNVIDADHPDSTRSELWKQLKPNEGNSSWNSQLELTQEFFKECRETPVPIDMRAYRVLSPAPMAMDIYAWLTYRASYIKKPTRPIPWASLQAQFGSGHPFTEQGLRDFRKAFKRNIDVVRTIYPDLKVDEQNAQGVILLPMRPHVPRVGATGRQRRLF